MKSQYSIALMGNPNSGKTTLFNNLTGSHQHVGNYPGVTVEKKEGQLKFKNTEFLITDLPGTYSLTTYSEEELIARNFIINNKPDVVINILDASNLERNLYLTVQLIELGTPLIVVLNMSDIAKSLGYTIDADKLSQELGAPVIQTVGHKGKGTKELLELIVHYLQNPTGKQSTPISYGIPVDDEIQKIASLIQHHPDYKDSINPYWLAIKSLEKDKEVTSFIKHLNIQKDIETSLYQLNRTLEDQPEVQIATARYEWINTVCHQAVRSSIAIRKTLSDKIDNVITHRLWGIPIFLLLMFLVFQLTFTLGEAPMGWIETSFSWLGDSISQLWPKSTDSMLKSLIVNGIIGGVGGVLVFLPNILLLFAAISILEDTGYMARVAFIMDRLMNKLGLHGKSFIPMLIGFGCSVPAIMATRTLDTKRDRLTTMLVIPLMSCGARLPIYALIIPAFFPSMWQGPVLWMTYITGVIIAILIAKLLRKFVLKGETSPFLMELPPYKIPTLKGTLIHVWERSSHYLKKAGTLILGVSILLWAMTTYPEKKVFDQDYEQLLNQALTNRTDDINALNTSIALSTDSDLLGETITKTMDYQSQLESYYESDPEYQNIEKQYAQYLSSLKNDPKTRTASDFLETLEEIRTVLDNHNTFIDENEVPEDSEEYKSLEKQKEIELNAIQKKYPVVYEAAYKYLTEIEPDYKEKIEGINHARQSELIAYSISGRMGKLMEPVIRPMGFDWKIGTALVGALAAKEVFVAQLGIVYSVGEADESSDSLRNKLKENYTSLTGICIILFSLLSMPCVATIATIKQESNSWKWAITQLIGLTVLAYVLTLMVYQIGSLFIA